MMAKDFQPEAYTNVYNERVTAYLETLEAGTAAPVIVQSAPASTGMDLLAALQASIDASATAKQEVSDVA